MAARFQAGSTVADYRVLDFVGAGGMGEVYRVIHPKTGRVAALKALTQCGQSEEFIRRFMNEARILSSLHHPNIVAFHDFVEYSGFPCIFMEYVDGMSLGDRIRTYGRLTAAEALAIFNPVLAAVAYIHARGIIHRDIKSNNIKIASTGQVKLLDFGIARCESTPQMTVTGGVIGTWQALAPEQIRGEPADVRSDIWALGVLLYEMLTGSLPFDGPTVFLLYEKIKKGSYRPISYFDSESAGELEKVVAHCLKRNPDDRFQTVEALFHALPQRSGPGTAKPEEYAAPAAENSRAGWLAGRRRTAALLAAILLLAVGVLFFFVDDTDVLKHKTDQVGSSATGAEERVQSVLIEVTSGQAEVFRDGARLGTTPYYVKAAPGEQVDLILKQEGCEDRDVSFTVTAATKGFTLSMRPR